MRDKIASHMHSNRDDGMGWASHYLQLIKATKILTFTALNTFVCIKIQHVQDIIDLLLLCSQHTCKI